MIYQSVWILQEIKIHGLIYQLRVVYKLASGVFLAEKIPCQDKPPAGDKIVEFILQRRTPVLHGSSTEGTY